MTATRKRHIAIRVAPADLEQIDQLAIEHGLTRTGYLIRAAVGELQPPATPHELDVRLDVLEGRIGVVERAANRGVFG
jgi:hypothetical protein